VNLGPLTLALAEELRRHEAPGVNTLYHGEPSVIWASATGPFVVDPDGRTYLDFTSGFGVAALGHRPPRVLRAVRAQLRTLLHGCGDVAAHPSRIALAARLAELAPMPNAQVYWATSGSDAVEVAIKTSRLATGRSAILAFDHAYHGLSHGALAATSRPLFREPFAPHLDPCVRHVAWGCDPATLAAALSAGDVAAVLLEPIPGREGVHTPPTGWLAAVAAIALEHQVLLIADEVLTGGGRTGSFWASRFEGITPDLVCFGKALGGGLPLAGVLASRDLFTAWTTAGEALHTGTFIAHPLACAAGLAAVEALSSPTLQARVSRLGRLLTDHLDQLVEAGRGPLARRGRGLMQAIDFVDATTAGQVARRCQDRGLLVLAGGRRGNTLQILPPLVLTVSQLASGLAILDLALSDETAG
jgi:4-aminobutyrate aminotransferase-like enzyme